MKQRILGFVCLIMGSFCAFGQSWTDTVQIDIVPIYAQSQTKYNNGAKCQQIDSLLINTSICNNLSELLARTSNVIIKNYGTEGMGSTVSLRGAGGSRTQVVWEGIPLNSIANGEHNLSLIPIQPFNHINIDFSASGANFGSGTFGGAIELKQIPQWENAKSLQASFSAGSFHTYKANIAANVGNERVQYNGNFMFTHSKSDFKYIDYIRLDTLKRKNANYTKYGTIQNLHFRISNHLFAQVVLWFQVNDSQLPALIGSNPNNAEQQTDSTIRTIFSLKLLYPRTSVIYRSALSNEYVQYSKKFTPHDTIFTEFSNLQTFTNFHTLNCNFKPYSKLETSLDLQGKFAKANVQNYGSPKHENSIAGVIHAKFKGNDLNANTSVRKEFNSQYQIPLIANIGAEYKIKNRILLRATCGNKFRSPSFNDLYWAEWGNPELKPESGFSTEIGAFFNLISKDSVTLSADVTTYQSTINNMIMWTPQGSVWHPFNTAQAILQGVELSVKQSAKFYKSHIFNNLGLNFNNPFISKTYQNSQNNQQVGHLLYYVPHWNLHYVGSFGYKHWEFSWFVNFESKRYFDLKKTLKPYATVDVSLKRTFILNNIKFVANVQILNLTNTIYEQIRSYPLPMRSFNASIQFFLN